MKILRPVLSVKTPPSKMSALSALFETVIFWKQNMAEYFPFDLECERNAV